MDDCDKSTLEQSESSCAVSQFAVGRRLQAVRRACGLSQRELARRANVTNGNLSLIEQGKVSPSLASLEKILKAIPMSLPEFFAEATEVPVVNPADSWVELKEGAAQMRIMSLDAGIGDSCHVVETVLPPGASESSGALFGAHSGLVAGMVLEGHLELRLDGIVYELDPRDGFHYAGCRGRQFSNRHAVPCRFVLFVQIAK